MSGFTYIDEMPRSDRHAQAFPILSDAQLARISVAGKRLEFRKSQVIANPGDREHLLLVVLSGSVDISIPCLRGETLVVVHQGALVAKRALCRAPAATSECGVAKTAQRSTSIASSFGKSCKTMLG